MLAEEEPDNQHAHDLTMEQLEANGDLEPCDYDLEPVDDALNRPDMDEEWSETEGRWVGF